MLEAHDGSPQEDEQTGTPEGSPDPAMLFAAGGGRHEHHPLFPRADGSAEKVPQREHARGYSGQEPIDPQCFLSKAGATAPFRTNMVLVNSSGELHPSDRADHSAPEGEPSTPSDHQARRNITPGTVTRLHRRSLHGLLHAAIPAASAMPHRSKMQETSSGASCA